MRISDWSSDVCSSDLLPLAFDGNCHERRVLHQNVELFDRSDKHIAAIRLTPDTAGEQAHHLRAADRRTLVKPCAVGRNPHFAVAAVRRVPLVHGRPPGVPDLREQGREPWIHIVSYKASLGITRGWCHDRKGVVWGKKG